jgi:hypothetical protein
MKIYKNGELVYSHESTEEDIFCMSKLTVKRADQFITGKIPVFIYFSVQNSSYGPMIKFDGGTSETDVTSTAPTLLLTKNGAGNIVLQDWMNKNNCPNAFNKKIVDAVSNFADKFISLLLLTWFERLDESETLDYFQGRESWNELLLNIINVPDDIYADIIHCESLDELHSFCLHHNLYRMP